MEKFRVYGASTREESQRERDHRALARKAAAEGMVLLKNDGVLPLKPGKVALYGAGSRMTVKGGSGSGDVHERYSVTIEEGLRNAGFTFPTTLWMDRFEGKYAADVKAWRDMVDEKCKKYSPVRTMQMFLMIGENPMPYPSVIPISDDELTEETDTAVYVVARQAGEGKDRRAERGDYLLSALEVESLKRLSAHYAKLILVINCGSVMDLSVLDETRIDAVVYYAQGGMEGGNAFGDVITGKVTPCGKLTDTWAMRYEDYPSADTFSHRNGVLDHEDYFEGIYVGYRWFEAKELPVRYPFGFGLSYTTFTREADNVRVRGTTVTAEITVANTGTSRSGKEVVQLYLAKPQGHLGAERKSLAAFAKTGLLAPGERETVTLAFDLTEQASFDTEKSAFLLEAGEYGILVGSSSADAAPVAVLTLSCAVVTEKVDSVCQRPLDFVDFHPDISDGAYDAALPRIHVDAGSIAAVLHPYKAPAEKRSPKVAEKLSALSENDLIRLCSGGGYSIKCFNNVMGAAGRTCTKLLKKGVPNIVLSDGPAGLNVNQSVAIMKDGTPRYPDGLPKDWQWGWLKRFGKLVEAKPGKGRPVYCFMTAWPNETLLAQTWDISLLEELGQAIGKEMLEIGVSVWLAPGLNIHRNPLCGRNFEYYSEDPVVSGKMAAAITRGVQSRGGVGVTIKHFCCNNQEDNRTGVSENVSQRALREIYLRGFRIAVQEGRPWTVMTSYNKVNGVYTSNSYDLCTKVLRCEWGFEGLVMSDWNATDQCSHAAAIQAGNDLLMPGNQGVRKALTAALKTGELNREALQASAARVLRMIFNSKTAQGF